MENDNIYFVYLLLDPRKSVIQPFYIGKGTRYRDTNHFRPSSQWNDTNKLKNRVIARIRGKDLKPIVFRWAEGLTEDEAFVLERSLIARFGRRDRKQGILTNLTDGGEGMSGYVFSAARKAEYSRKFSGKKNPMHGRSHTEESRKKIAQTRKQKISIGKIIPTKHSEEHKQHLRDDVDRRRVNGFGRPARRIHKIDSTGQIVETYESTTAFAEALGLKTNSNIKNIASAGCKQRDGFWYRYSDVPKTF